MMPAATASNTAAALATGWLSFAAASVVIGDDGTGRGTSPGPPEFWLIACFRAVKTSRNLGVLQGRAHSAVVAGGRHGDRQADDYTSFTEIVAARRSTCSGSSRAGKSSATFSAAALMPSGSASTGD